MGHLGRDVRVALRRLAATPGFTLFAVVSLGVGIGTTAAVYASARAFFWMPLAISAPDRLLAISPGRGPQAISWPDFEDLRTQSLPAFSGLAAAARFTAAIAAGDAREVSPCEAVSADYFAVLGAAPRLGRLLLPGDDRSAARVTVVSESFWKTRLRHAPGAIGTSISIAGERYEVVGVVRGFQGIAAFPPTVAWIPARALPARAGRTPIPLAARAARAFSVWGRLAPSATAARADAEIRLAAAQLDAAFPAGGQGRQWTAHRSALDLASNDNVDNIGTVFLIAVFSVLLIACTNLANLMLARGSARAQEVAVRAALGASRGRLMREQIVESVLLAAAGTLAGIRLTQWLLTFFARDLPLGPSAMLPFRPEIDVPVLAAAAAAGALAVVVSGLWPALQGTRPDIRGGLGAGATATPPKWRLHRTLVAWQVTGSVALFLAAAMCVSIIDRLPRGPAQDEYARVAMAEVDFERNGRSPEEAQRLLGLLRRDLESRPEIEQVAFSDGFPAGLFMFPSGGRVTTPEQLANGGAETGRPASVIGASPEFAATTGLALLRGRWFTADDTAGAPRVAVVSEWLARAIFQETAVVGRHIVMRNRPATGSTPAPDDEMTIVGVAPDPSPYLLGMPAQAMLYVPFAQRTARDVLISVRAATPARAATALRSAIRRTDPEIAIGASGPAAQVLAGPLQTLRLISAMATALGTLALVLAMAGLHGVLSHVVARRTRELGIRVAIGASRRQVGQLILRDGSRPVLKGLVLGLMIGIGVRIAIAARIHTSASAIDPWLLAVLPLPFAAAALIACALPVLRATRVDPNIALRDL